MLKKKKIIFCTKKNEYFSTNFQTKTHNSMRSGLVSVKIIWKNEYKIN